MLTRIHIRDFAIIDELELELGAGMTALTGETGAGKSILLDALGLVLGDRGDAQVVRGGAARAEIVAEFELANLPDVTTWLAEQDLDADGECLMRRVVNADGRSRGHVNGRPVPMALLRELGEQLVDIHGQHEHQSLRKRDNQRALLDAFGELDAPCAAVASAWDAWRETRDRLAGLRKDDGDPGQRLDLLRYQVQELAALDLSADEIDALDAEQRRLAHAGRLIETCQRVLGSLHDEDWSAHGLLSTAHRDLESVTELDRNLASAAELVSTALIQCDEAVTAIREVAEGSDLDPARLQQVEQRLQAIHDLARKHRVQPNELPARGEALRRELDARLAREGRTELAQACFDFLPTRAKLDLLGWPETDIFAH